MQTRLAVFVLADTAGHIILKQGVFSQQKIVGKTVLGKIRKIVAGFQADTHRIKACFLFDYGDDTTDHVRQRNGFIEDAKYFG